MSLLGKAPIAKLECHIPAAGGWRATATLAGGAVPALGATTLTIGTDLVLTGTIVDADEDAPGRPNVIVYGGAGWRLPVARGESWQSSGGVRLKTVLTALQRATGEPLAMPTDVSLGEDFGWPMASPFAPFPYGDVLGILVRRRAVATWRVAPNGDTRFDPWPSLGAADAKGRLLRRNLDVGLRVYGLDARAAAFLPGSTVEGITTARITYREDAGKLEAETWER